MRKFISIASLITAASLVACAESEPTVTPPATALTTTDPVAALDFGGWEINVAQYNSESEPEEKRSNYDELLWEHRNNMAKKHNYTFSKDALTTYMDSLEFLSTTVLAEDPGGEIHRMPPEFANAIARNHLAYDLTTLENIDVTDPKWNPVVTEMMTVGGAVYGVVKDLYPEKTVYFNKRLFEEAGLDPDLLYDLQAADQWTWEAFEEVSAKLTRDTNNDGITDHYAFALQPTHFFEMAILSNHGSIIGKDKNDIYFNNAGSPETLQALEWAIAYYNKGYDTIPTPWKSIPNVFMNGDVAMFLGDVWNARDFAAGMEDDYGIVCFPKGPKGSLTVQTSGQGYVIPSTYTKEEAEMIALAFDQYNSLPPGYDAQTAWKDEHYPLYRDSRAVDETHAIALTPGTAKSGYDKMISADVKITALYTDIYLNGLTPAEAVQKHSPVWQVALDVANAR